jgi:hypothetical protein
MVAGRTATQKVGREVRLCYMGHATMENRHGLAVAGMVTLANGTAERRAAETMLKAKAKEAAQRITVGEDKAYFGDGHALKAVIEDTENSPAALSRAPLSTRDTATMMWKTHTASSSRARSVACSASSKVSCDGFRDRSGDRPHEGRRSTSAAAISKAVTAMPPTPSSRRSATTFASSSPG